MKTGDASPMFRLVPVFGNKPKHYTFICQYTLLVNVSVSLAIIVSYVV